ncbi:MAG: hypothetical protein JNM10_17905, partial [Planctomycetia bacterium]|nr:hypothetical protein [Planctomycetia bacterium]
RVRVAVLPAVGLLVAAALSGCGEASRPAAPSAVAAGAPARCGGCHANEATAWAASPHARHAVAVATPEGGADAAIGSHWMQAYLRKDADGVHRIVPTCFDLRERRWRPVTDVLAAIAGGDAGFATGPLPAVASRSFDADCAGCHASGAHVRFDTVEGHLVSAWRDLAIDCEACHGAAEGHRTGRPGTIVRLQDLTPRGQVMVCGRCHGGPASDGDLGPTEAATGLARLGDHAALFPDGVAGGQTYQVASFVRSACFLEGGLTCTGCHDAHGKTLRHGGDVDATCVGCHADRVGSAHSRHDPAGPGGSCVACHMPALLGGLLRQQHDHRLGVPVPGIAGTRDACSACHADRDPATLRAAWTGWWGPVPARRDAVVAAVTALRRGDAAAAGAFAALADDPDAHVRATGARAGRPLAAFLRDPSPDARAAAVRATATIASSDDVAAFLRDPEPRVRGEAATVLALRGDPRAREFDDDLVRLARGDREHVLARYALALARLHDRRPAEALRFVEQALVFEAGSPDLWFLAAEAHRVAHRETPFRAAVARGVALVGDGLARGEAAEAALGRFVAAQINGGRGALAAAILAEAADALPDPAVRARFAALRDRLGGPR